MKTIIAGSRSITPWQMDAALKACPWQITEVVCGMARGADTLGLLWATHLGLPVHKYSADWDSQGKGAGRIRNEHMARNAEALLAVWDGQSPGTKHMIQCAEALGLRVYVHNTAWTQVYAFDIAEQMYYATQRCYVRGNTNLVEIGECLERGPDHTCVSHGIGTQADFQRALLAKGFPANQAFPVLGVDPIPF